MTVDTLSAQGEPQLTGDVTLSAGSGIALTQTGQNIEIENTIAISTSDAPPVAGYTSWLDATQLSSMTITDERVSPWNDLSAGGANDASNASATGRPYLTRYVQNARSGVLWPSGLANIVLDSAETVSDITSSWYIVAEAFALLGTAQTLTAGSGGTGGIQIRLSATNGFLEVNKQGLAQIGITTFGVTADQTFAASVRLSGTDCKMRINSSEETDAHAQTLTAGRTLRLGANNAGAEAFVGIMHEIIVYGSQLSDGDDDLVMAYLKDKWGTP